MTTFSLKFLKERYDPQTIATEKGKTPKEKIKKLANALNEAFARIEELEALPDGLNKLLEKHEKKTRWGYATDNLIDKYKHQLDNYADASASAIANVQKFRDDLSVWFRALIITLEMTGNAGTHAEKAARLRGAIEICEAVANDLRKSSLEFYMSPLYFRNVFESNFPVRHYKDRIYELESQVAEMTKQNTDD